MERRLRFCPSLSLPPLQGLPLSLLSGQTAEELLHFPLPLCVSETRSEEQVRGVRQQKRFTKTLRLGRRFLSRPVHDLIELLPGQEARVLPDLPQSALELLLVLVLQSLLLPLLSGAATLLSVVQPENYFKHLMKYSKQTHK